MPNHLQAVLVAGFLCACSAPAVPLATGPDNPADPSAPSVPFVRPANVLETANPASATTASPLMAGMNMSGASDNRMRPMPGMGMPQAVPPRPTHAAIGEVSSTDAVTALPISPASP